MDFLVGTESLGPGRILENASSYGIGVRRNAWVWPPTVPVPVISPLSLIPVAICKTHPDPGGISVFRSVITPFCQTNARPDVGELLLAWPTTTPWALIAHG